MFTYGLLYKFIVPFSENHFFLYIISVTLRKTSSPRGEYIIRKNRPSK